MSEPAKGGRPFFTLPRVFALAAVILLGSAGLCGMQLKFQPDEYVTFEGIAGGFGLLIGAGLLLSAIVGAIFGFVKRLLESRKNKP